MAQPSDVNDHFWLGTILWRRWRLIALVFILGTGAAAALLHLRAPNYTASTEILIERDETQFSNSTTAGGVRFTEP